MTNPWDGHPQNPDRRGWHWLLFRDGEITAAEWSGIANDREPWGVGSDWWACERVQINCTYLGPCLTPAEVEAEKILAREEGRIAGFEEAMDDLRGAPPLGVNRHGVMYLSPPEVEARVAAARREGIEAAIEAAMRVPIPEDASVAEAHGRLAAAQDICARIGALLEENSHD